MAGLAIITEACIDVKDRACVDVCPVQCIYEFDPTNNVLFSEEQAGSGVIETSHTPNAGRDRDLRRQHALREPRRVHVVHRVLPARRLSRSARSTPKSSVPDGSPTKAEYNAADPNKGHDHTFFIQHSRDVFAD